MISLKSDTYDMEGHEYEKQKNFKECGRSMLAAAESLPDHPKHAERLWNAGQCFQNAHLVGQALKARLALIQEHPKDPLAQKALFRVAAGYHQLAYYSKAVGLLRGLRQQVPGREEGDRRARQRDDLPHRPRREREGARRHGRVREVLRHAQAAGRRRRLLPDGRRLREGQELRRAGQAPRELPQEVGPAGRSRSPGAGALPPRRDGVEGLVPEGVGGRRLPRDQARRGHRPPEGPLRPQQEAEEGQEDQGAEADAVRAAHQLEDHRLRPQQDSKRPRPRSTSRPC